MMLTTYLQFRCMPNACTHDAGVRLCAVADASVFSTSLGGWDRCVWDKLLGPDTNPTILHRAIFPSSSTFDDDWVHENRDCSVTATPSFRDAICTAQPSHSRPVVVFDLLRDGANV